MAQDKDKIISELLRSADKSIKEKKLDDALINIKKVFEIDPRNVYARAYQERLSALKAEAILQKTPAKIEEVKQTAEPLKNENVPIQEKIEVEQKQETKQTPIVEQDVQQKNAEPERKIEPKIEETKPLTQSENTKGSILVLDDDEVFLNLTKQMLEDDGYSCKTVVSGEEGLKVLEHYTPEIVVCDVDFSKSSTMSGFSFYQQFRSIDRFVNTPFIFLSGMNPDIIIRSIKQMGADDYLKKPVDQELFLLTIEGKLKRARELRKATSHH